MKFYNYLNENIENQLDEVFKQGYHNLQSLELREQEFDFPVNEADPISITLIVSTLLAAPSIIESIAKAIGFIYKKIRKLFGKSEDEGKVVEKLIKVSEKWHKSYIAVLRQILRATGVFKQVEVKDKGKQEMITESVFYLIILGFAVHGGIATYQSISYTVSHMSLGHTKMAAIEGALTHLKSREVKNFISQLITKA